MLIKNTHNENCVQKWVLDLLPSLMQVCKSRNYRM